MGSLFHNSLSAGSQVLLIACLLLALGFEFVNGFHDTANAVATVIYTNSLRPRLAVLISGIFNFLGVLVGGIAVAMAIIKLLPVELLVQGGPGVAIAMVLSLLLAAILWNVGTWYFGLPSSSSHTLIGSILGVGLANSLVAGHSFGAGLNWHKIKEIAASLLISPLIGFAAAGLLFLVFKRFARNRGLLEAPVGKKPPPIGTRTVLIGTCSAVSFAHGSNDGQKGVGLVMLILIGLLPTAFALDPSRPTAAVTTAIHGMETMLAQPGAAHTMELEATRARLEDLRGRLGTGTTIADVPEADRFAMRRDILLADKAIDGLLVAHEGTAPVVTLTPAQRSELASDRATLRQLTDYAPTWVIAAIAIALGLGTMVGWKRIVVTVGEKIGKDHLTYAQGMSAELVAATAIGIASSVGLPVSTTHVLSSGVAGTMVANRSGLNGSTVRNIALAWVFTLPASIAIAGLLFLVLRLIFV